MAFCWRFCDNIKVKAVLFGVLVFFLILTAVESNCNYFQNLENGKTYYVYNHKYPSKDEGKINCIWQTTNPYITKVSCSIDIPTNSCTKNSFSIQFAEKKIQKYCGFGTFVLEGINATIKLELQSNTTGRFLCGIRAEKQIDENNCKCGWKKVTRIINGEETGVNEYPMMCGLVDIRKKIIYCGCTIISNQYVITAAHCLEKRSLSDCSIVVGEHDVTTGKETNATKLFRISKCNMHPYYKDIHNDIAICKINGTIEYSAEVGPVCLPFQHKEDSFCGDIVTALGWGLLQFGGKKSNTLQKVGLNVINSQNCQQYYHDITKKNICTFTSGKDTCQMDSGGPVLWKNPITRNIVLIGITSYGYGCASDVPSVDTRTGAFIDWIESVTPDVHYCKIE